jgi:hypothetical protein
MRSQTTTLRTTSLRDLTAVSSPSGPTTRELSSFTDPRDGNQDEGFDADVRIDGTTG